MDFTEQDIGEQLTQLDAVSNFSLYASQCFFYLHFVLLPLAYLGLIVFLFTGALC